MKKMSKLERVRAKFYYDDCDDPEPELRSYGTYRLGLTREEIKDYLRARANKIRVEKLYKEFCKIAGVNTMGVYTCPDCGMHKSLMYRHDVKRFADVLFKGIPTYWD